MKGHFRVGECHSPPAHMALGYPYFLEIRETDGRTDIPKLEVWDFFLF